MRGIHHGPHFGGIVVEHLVAGLIRVQVLCTSRVDEYESRPDGREKQSIHESLSDVRDDPGFVDVLQVAEITLSFIIGNHQFRIRDLNFFTRVIDHSGCK